MILSLAGDEHEHVAGRLRAPGNTLVITSPWFDHVCTQVPSDKVQIRTNSEGVQMVFGTCPILVEGNEYIFRWEMFMMTTNVI